MTAPSKARVIATAVLVRVAEDGAWAAPALDAELARSSPESRDAALATEIVYGTLRALAALDEAIGAHLTRKKEIDPLARASLRAGAYQLLHLSGVPPHATVADQVEIVRRARGPRVAGFVNAVLRKIAASRPAHPEPPRALALPAWLSAALVSSLGQERAAAFAELRELPPPTGLRVVDDRIAREALVAEIQGGEGGRRPPMIQRASPRASARLGELSPLAVLARRMGDPRALPSYAAGAFAVQEQGAQVVALLAGAREGESVADVCAGRGGKTALLRERVGPRARVVALDLHETKLERLSEELSRLGLAPVETLAVDLTVGVGGLDGQFDRVLVDAPCTGVGTVHRRPELLLRLGADDPARMAETQRAILATAARLCRPGGALVHAVCSPLAAEGRAVAEHALGAVAGLALDTAPLPTDPLAADPDGVFRIGPWTDDCDAYQVIRFRVH
jgi:16S rRNA (cytosine967-C5)-methyltransferase